MSHSKKNVPLYKIIETELMEKINNNFYKVGSSIPTENQLAQKYDVSRVTVRQATNNLVAQGILIRNRGSGTFVAKKISIVERAVKIVGFKEEMEGMGKKTSTEILTFEITRADESIAQKLKIATGEAVYYIVRLRKADEKPMVLETSYMSVKKYPDLTYEIMMNSKYEYIEIVKNMEIDYCHHVVLPVIPSQVCATLLGLEAKEPVIKVLNTTYFKDGEVLDYTELLFNSAAYKYIAIKTR